MGKIKDFFKKIIDLPGYKTFIILILVGGALLCIGKILPNYSYKETSTLPEKSSHTEQETKLAEMLSGIEGVGDVEVIINTKDKTDSVLILAAGADDPIVQIKIRQAVRTVLQTDNDNIKIAKKKS